MARSIPSFIWVSILWLSCCASDTASPLQDVPELTKNEAEIKNVEVSGTDTTYTFNVTIASPDTGCNQYADWWEVVDLQGNLMYRRILAHSHVNEQPFSRSGGAVAINNTQEVYVRLHMNNSGYSENAMKGRVMDGFTTVTLEADFASNLEQVAPLPNGCAF